MKNKSSRQETEAHAEVKSIIKLRMRSSKLGRFVFGQSSSAPKPESETAPASEPQESLGYRPGTIEAPIMPPGGRGLDVYERKMLFNRNELKGKRVLDLGCGPEVKFARELKEADIDAMVVSLSPDFNNPEYLDKARSLYDGRLVAGLGQDMPFEDKSFDAIFAFYVFDHLSLEEVRGVIHEMARVLAEDGVAKMGPILNAQVSAYIKDFTNFEDDIQNDQELSQYLRAEGVTVKQVTIPEEIVPPQKIYDEFGSTGRGLSSLLVLSKQSGRDK